MAKANSRLSFSLSIFAVGALLLLQSYVGEKTRAAGADVGPMFYPRILLWGWTILSGAMCVNALRKPTAPPAPLPNRAALFWAIGLTLIFGFCLEYVGFFILSVLFCFLYPYTQGYRRLSVLIPFCILYTTFVWYVFNYVLYIFLPEMHWLEEVL